MKTKRLISLIVCIAMAVTAIAVLAACKKNDKTVSLGTTTLNLENYVYVDKGVTNSKTINLEQVFEGSVYDEISISSPFIFIKKGKTYDIYSTDYNKMVLTDITGYPSQQSLSYYTYNVLCIRNGSGYPYNYDYYTPDGQLILESVQNSQLSCSVKYYYVNKSTTSKAVYVLSAIGADNRTVTAYFDISTKDGKTTYTELTKNSLSVVSGEYAAGQTAPLKNWFVLYGDDFPVESEIRNYRYQQAGEVTTFYKDGKQVGSLDLSGKKIIGVIDHYVYYYGLKPLADNVTSGYNYCGENNSKAFETLYKYDVFTNRTTAYNYDVHITSIEPAYNYVGKTFDAAVVKGYKKVDGVYYENVDSDYKQKFTYVTDANLKVAKDFSATGFTAITKLSDERYSAVGQSTSEIYLLDKNFNVINLPGSSHVFYPDQKLVRFTVGNYLGFADFNGKIVIEPKYTFFDSYSSNPIFYNGYTLLTNAETGETVAVNNLGEEVKLPESGGSLDQQVSVRTGYYTVKIVNNLGTGTYSYYTYSGELIRSFTLNSQRSIETVNGLIKYTNGENVTYYMLG